MAGTKISAAVVHQANAPTDPHAVRVLHPLVPGSVEACAPPPSGLFFRWHLPPRAKTGALLHPIDLDLET